MKTKKRWQILSALAAVLTALVFTLAACADAGNSSSSSSSPNTPGEDGLVSLVLFKEPSKTEYYIGETFDPSGMVVKANYEDGRSVNVLYADCTYKTDPLTTDDTKIVITYGSQSATVAITVTAVPEITDDDTPQVTGIVLAKNPTKTEYLVGGTFDPMGMVVKAKYDDGSEFPIPNSELTYSTAGLTLTDTFVRVAYQGFTVDVNIAVNRYALRITSEDHATYRAEAENADLSTYELTGWAAGKDKVESSGSASGSRLLGNLSAASGYVEYTLYSEVEGTVALYLCGANGTGKPIALSNAFSMSWNGNAFTPEDAIESSGWGTWQKVALASVSLRQGENTLRITMKGTAPNLDYVEFEVNKPADSYDVRMTDGATSWTAEAEKCTVAGTPANGKTSFFEGAGTYLCNLGKTGNTVTVTIWSDTARTVSVAMKASHGYSGEWATLEYFDTFSATLNGAAVSLSGQFTATGWTTFAQFVLGNIDLQQGANTLVFTVKQAHVPNIDAFIFATV